VSGDRGFITWKPRGETSQRLDMIQAVLSEYRNYLPLTGRQIFYRCVGQYGYSKTERAYKNLLYVAAKARRAGLIKFSSIRDDGVTIDRPLGYREVQHFKERITDFAEGYRRMRQIGQANHIILLCEAAGMVPQLANIAGEYGVEVRSSGGYDSVTAKYELAADIIDAAKPTILLHVGDLDPSGEDIFVNIQEDVGAFVQQLAEEDLRYGNGIGGSMEAVRIAVTRDQAEAMELPTAPAKATDSRAKRFVGETVQCEAIPPNVLDQIVRDAITSRLDMDAFDRNLAKEREERERIEKAIRVLRFDEVE
jgi:hypothetical protein